MALSETFIHMFMYAIRRQMVLKVDVPFMKTTFEVRKELTKISKLGYEIQIKLEKLEEAENQISLALNKYNTLMSVEVDTLNLAKKNYKMFNLLINRKISIDKEIQLPLVMTHIDLINKLKNVATERFGSAFRAPLNDFLVKAQETNPLLFNYLGYTKKIDIVSLLHKKRQLENFVSKFPTRKNKKRSANSRKF